LFRFPNDLFALFSLENENIRLNFLIFFPLFTFQILFSALHKEYFSLKKISAVLSVGISIFISVLRSRSRKESQGATGGGVVARCGSGAE
jgi:formate hydrogenlyase subunit 3/multisubunit Na+/H+ antiporter MnhD subunit